MLKPNRKDFNVDAGLHAAMDVYARTFDKPNANVTVTFKDGSVFTDSFEPATKELKYAVGYGADVEDYYVTVDRGTFDGSYLLDYHEERYMLDTGKDTALTLGKLKKLFLTWIQENVEDTASIKWSKTC